MVCMTDPDPRAAFAAMTAALITDFRANRGQVTSGPFAGRPVLLLTTTGAKSGQPRLAPLVYSRDGDHYVIVASKGGAPTHPAWYQNLLAHPTVTVEVGEGTFEARARVTEGPSVTGSLGSAQPTARTSLSISDEPPASFPWWCSSASATGDEPARDGLVAAMASPRLQPGPRSISCRRTSTGWRPSSPKLEARFRAVVG
jgi:deazaflavin-dependent oxidoreductase (nitroreductase family)